MLADLVHHIRLQLNPLQLGRIIHIYTCLFHNTALNGSIQTMCAKLLMNLIDCIIQKDTPEGCIQILQGLMVTCIDKLESLNELRNEVMASTQRAKSGTADSADPLLIEKAKPHAGAAYATEAVDDILKGEYNYHYN